MSNNNTTRNIRWLTSDFDHIGRNHEDRDGEYFISELLSRPRDEIAFGAASDKAAKDFGGLQRQMYECSDWMFYRNLLLKKKDPIEQALDGDAGHDWTEGDLPEVLEKLQNNPAAIEWLLKSEMKSDYELNDEDAIAHSEFNLKGLVNYGDDDLEENGEVDEEFDTSNFSIINEIDVGYTPPRDKYVAVERTWRVSYKEAAERRARYFKQLLDEIHRMGSQTKLVDVQAKNLGEEVEMFIDRIREAYAEDKKICDEWNDKEKTFYRNMYTHFMRRQGLDEEEIRRNLYYAFDRVRRETWDVFTNGKFYKTYYHRPNQKTLDYYGSIAVQGKMTKPSFWDKCKSNEFTKLTLTMRQWGQVYEVAWNKLLSAVKLMAMHAETSDDRFEVRCLINRISKNWNDPIGYRKFQTREEINLKIQEILNSMPKKVRG